jgi:protein-S-isoprenylcysteine O-methyltransferase Ste14
VDERQAEKDIAGVIAPPPVIVLAGMLIGAGISFLLPWRLPTAGRSGALAGATLVAAAVTLAVLAIREFRASDTPVPTREPTRAIVAGGPYRLSRNPIYLSFVLLQVGIALWAANGWLLATLAVEILIIDRGVIAREERYLERRFGETYLAYKRGVRRWI